MEESKIGKVYVSATQYAKVQMAIQTPATFVGKISEQRTFGTGPKPITKEQKYTTTLVEESTAWSTESMPTVLEIIRITSEPIRKGIVVRRSHLPWKARN